MRAGVFKKRTFSFTNYAKKVTGLMKFPKKSAITAE
jgi:hypothetical protein